MGVLDNSQLQVGVGVVRKVATGLYFIVDIFVAFCRHQMHFQIEGKKMAVITVLQTPCSRCLGQGGADLGILAQEPEAHRPEQKELTLGLSAVGDGKRERCSFARAFQC